jgi:hypothetical protein
VLERTATTAAERRAFRRHAFRRALYDIEQFGFIELAARLAAHESHFLARECTGNEYLLAARIGDAPAIVRD